MIRHQHGNEYFLFTQDDHAHLSGTLAGHFGNARFAAPAPREPVVTGIRMHDSGWPLHDLAPTLNDQGIPLHVFESPVPVAVRVWTESVRLAREANSYSGLLVSLHVFALSALSYQHLHDPRDKRRNAKELFELNKFQQLQVEVQEEIRREFGMRTDMPLQLGLAPAHTGQAEDKLRLDYQLLKVTDQLSLALLCQGRPFSSIDDVVPRPGSNPIDFHIGYPTAWSLNVSPWPFSLERLDAEIPFRRVPATTYVSVEALREVYASAPQEMQTLRVVKSS